MSHLNRLQIEKAELDQKIESLRAFVWDGNDVYDSLPQVDTNLLANQLHTMRAYSEILKQRIERG